MRVLVVLLVACCSLAACAEDDPPGQVCQMRTVAEMQVLNDQGSPLIRATVNGTPVAFIVDTGAGGTVLFEQAAERLGLPIDRDGRRMAEGIGGTVFSSLATVDALSLGTAASHHMEFDSIPGPIASTKDGLPVIGLFGGDFLANYDVEFDLPNHLVTLFQERHCSGNLRPWPTGAFYRLPFELQDQTRIAVDITVDGHPTPVFLDSGAYRTIIDSYAARRSGATEATMAADKVSVARGIDQNAMQAHRHRFDTLDIGPEHFAPAYLEVADMQVSGLLGADYFRARRVWISYPHGVAYVQRVVFPNDGTPASGGSASAAGVPKH